MDKIMEGTSPVVAVAVVMIPLFTTLHHTHGKTRPNITVHSTLLSLLNTYHGREITCLLPLPHCTPSQPFSRLRSTNCGMKRDGTEGGLGGREEEGEEE